MAMIGQNDLQAQYPGPVVLYQGRRSAIFIFAGGCLLALSLLFTTGVFNHSRSMMWVCIAAGSWPLLILLFNLKRGSMTLTFSSDGFETYTMGGIRKSLWRNVTDIHVGRTAQGAKRVLFNDSAWTNALARWSTSTFGYNGFLPDNYGMTADALADLMKGWQARALGHPATN
jgi:hypothetical protein